MIYFKQKIKPFKSKTGMNLVPVKVDLIDGSTVYKLPSNFEEEIKAKGAIVIENFDINQIKPVKFN
jgi:hypothetical protein